MRSFMLLFCIIFLVLKNDAYGKLNRVCRMPQDVGPCEAIIPRYYFNTASGECEFFEYGGCEGNDNNFETEADCVRTCECSLNKDSGEGGMPETRWYFNKKFCRTFTYYGTGGNANNFLTQEACQMACTK